MTMTARPACDNRILDSLRQILGDRLSVGLAERDHHGKDVSYLAGHPPEAVAYVQTSEEVSAVVEVCAANGVAVVPYGTGTSLEGHLAAQIGRAHV